MDKACHQERKQFLDMQALLMQIKQLIEDYEAEYLREVQSDANTEDQKKIAQLK